MKHDPFRVGRAPVKPGLFRKLHAATRTKRQKVAAAPAYDDYDEEEEGGSKLSRSLVIIFLFHIVLIGLIFVHYRYLRNRTSEAPSQAVPLAAQVAQAPSTTGETTHIVRQGEDYPQIAAALGVNEAVLRSLNQNVQLQKGMLARIPAPAPPAVQPVAATSLPSSAASQPNAPVAVQPSLVPAVDVTNAPRARAVPAPTNEPLSRASSYIVRPGDSIILIAKRLKIHPNALIQANRITDPKKIRPGMKLTVPSQ